MIYHHILDKSLDHKFGTQFFKFQVVIVIHKGQLMSYAMKMQNVIVKLMLSVVNVWNVLLAIFPFPHAMKVKANNIVIPWREDFLKKDLMYNCNNFRV